MASLGPVDLRTAAFLALVGVVLAIGAGLALFALSAALVALRDRMAR